jgi:voltage-gated potassium channel
MQFDDPTGIRTRLLAGLLGVLTALFGGSAGYYLLGRGRWSYDDCLYMAAISLTTVGYGEIIDVGSVPGARLYTILLILLGMGVIVYFGSTVVAFIVEGEIKQYFGRKKMNKDIESLNKHVIICGGGATGATIIREMQATRTPFIVIEANEDRIRQMMNDEKIVPFPYIIGDATADSVLVQAGINRACGLVAALPDDKDNVFVVISARQLNAKLRIVSRGTEPNIAEKLLRVGADSVVSPNNIGGMRLASEIIRPRAVEFLDRMLQDKDHTLRVEEVTVNKGSRIQDKTLEEADIRSHADVLVIAVRQPSGNYIHNPRPELILQESTVLILIGVVEEVTKLKKICHSDS